jgi:transposase
MSKELVSDELWQIVEPLLPTEPSKARGGRPRIPDRAVLSGIVFVLKRFPLRLLALFFTWLLSRIRCCFILLPAPGHKVVVAS